MPTKSAKKEAYLKERENGFDLRFCCSSSRRPPAYDALRDVNMRHYFESEPVQKHLLETGQLDEFGRIVDSDGQRSRLRTVENEIERAERMERLLEKDADDARYLVRKERFREIDEMRHLENVERQKYETRMQMELTRVEREALGHTHLYARNDRMAEGENKQKLLTGDSEARV